VEGIHEEAKDELTTAVITRRPFETGTIPCRNMPREDQSLRSVGRKPARKSNWLARKKFNLTSCFFPKDDAHRHQHAELAEYLRQRGAVPGSGNRVANLIKAAAEGDDEEVMHCIKASVDVNCCDYDKRTPLMLAASNGHLEVVKLLCEAGADVNAQDRWERTALDDATAPALVQILVKYGARKGATRNSQSAAGQSLDLSSGSGQRVVDNMKVETEDLEMIDKIGSGAFGTSILAT
jgi:hypothetical protein